MALTLAPHAARPAPSTGPTLTFVDYRGYLTPSVDLQAIVDYGVNDADLVLPDNLATPRNHGSHYA